MIKKKGMYPILATNSTEMTKPIKCRKNNNNNDKSCKKK
uniref:Uncharacterized protein n=1 Tax=Rhizophora mucronata TaxID=61149 RepID=A0A2P2NC60_RHIMU